MNIEIGHQGVVWVVSFEGAIDIDHALRARDALLSCIRRSEEVQIDLSRVTFIDTSGLAALVQCFSIARKKSARMAVVATNLRTSRVIELARLQSLFACPPQPSESVH